MARSALLEPFEHLSGDPPPLLFRSLGCHIMKTGSTVAKTPKGSYGVKLVRGPLVSLQPHPEAVSDPSDLGVLAAGRTKPLAADLFCGAGGLSLGLETAGFDVILGVDTDDFALETHRANHPGLSVNWDLSDDDVVESVGELIRDLGISLVAGGPPCQPFSKAGISGMRSLVREGRREAHDDRRDLWQNFLRATR